MPEATEVHHRVPRRLLAAHHRMVAREQLDGEALQLWLEYEEMLSEFGLAPGLSREELVEEIEASAVAVSREEHRYWIHAPDWARWGREGGSPPSSGTDALGSATWHGGAGGRSPPASSRASGSGCAGSERPRREAPDEEAGGAGR